MDQRTELIRSQYSSVIPLESLPSGMNSHADVGYLLQRLAFLEKALDEAVRTEGAHAYNNGLDENACMYEDERRRKLWLEGFIGCREMNRQCVESLLEYGSFPIS